MITNTETGQHALYKIQSHQDMPITQPLKSLDALSISHRFLEIANRFSSMDPLLEAFVTEIKAFTGCDAVGVRVLDEQGNIPYKAYTGFCREFYELENKLSLKLDKCVCIDVITGNRNTSTSEYYSEYGSFSIGSIKRHKTTHSPLVPIGGKKMRGNCPAFGYDTLTMIPIFYGVRVLGLIHIADSRPDMVPPEKLGILEKIALQLGVALSRVLMEQEVLNSQATLETKVFEKTNELQQLNSQLSNELEEKRRITNALLASEEKYRSLFNTITEGVIVGEIIYDQSGKAIDFRYLMINPAFEKMARLKATDVISGTSRELLLDLEQNRLNLFGEVALTGKTASFEEFISRLDKWFAITAFKVTTGKFAVLFTDITEIKNLHIHLEDLVKQRNSQLKDAYDILVVEIAQRREEQRLLNEALNRELVLHERLKKEMTKRIEFTRALVHELKTPLTPVLASSDMLLNISPDGPIKRLASQIYTGAVNLNTRTNELFDLTRGELGILELRKQMIYPGKLVKELAVMFRPVADKKQIRLTTEITKHLPRVIADKQRLHQVLANLVDNAIKYTPENGKVAIVAIFDSQNIVFKVRDTGPGISPADQSELFKPYSRLPKNRSHFGGTGLGLGLAISKIFVKLHGGTITVQSQAGKGSVFTVSLPIKPGVEMVKGERDESTCY
jgi:signal transduction histidine kinase/GAF domain-containing protein